MRVRKSHLDFRVSDFNCGLRIDARWKSKHRPDGRSVNVGHIELDDDNMVVHAEVKSYARGMGIGKHLYEAALKHRGEIRSDLCSASDQAKGVWKSLVKKYRHRFDRWNCTLTVYDHRL